MDISVILATYKRSDILEKTLFSFLDLNIQKITWELIVVDNAIDKQTNIIVHKFGEKLPVSLLIEPQPGKNAALNTAIPYCKGHLLVFTDDDIIADPDWLLQILIGAARWPAHNIFGGRILPKWPAEASPPDLPLDSPFLINAYSIADWNFGEQEYSGKLVFGANMAIRAEVFANGLRFDGSVGPSQKKNYIMGSETSLIKHLESIGHKPVYLPNAIVHHIIRPEQLLFHWLKKRAMRSGRGVASRESIDSATIFNIPRYLLRRLLETYCESKISRDKKKRAILTLKVWYLIGKISQFYSTQKTIL